MLILRLPLFLVAAACLHAAEFDLVGRVVPEESYPISLQGATSPFRANTFSELNGSFRFHKLPAGTYTVVVFEPGYGEVRRTVDVGPGAADSKRRVKFTIDLARARHEDSDAPERRVRVSVLELSLPKEAQREYDEAIKRLEQRDVKGAVAHLKRAVEIAPKYSDAWNHLGTIAYQTGDYPTAEHDFRNALDASPNSFEALVNLGGVLVNLGKWDEALQFNLEAVKKRPTDALANSQLGMVYFHEANFDLARKYLVIAKRSDPAHFSHPQRMLAEIYLQRKEPIKAAAELEDLLKQHPDLPDSAAIQQQIARLRATISANP